MSTKPRPISKAFRGAHVCKPHRKVLGKDWRNRTLVGYDISCSCGWRRNTNEDLKRAREFHTEHVRQQLDLAFPDKAPPAPAEPARVKSTDLSRAALIQMIGKLRGALYGVSDSDVIELVLGETTFDVVGEDDVALRYLKSRQS